MLAGVRFYGILSATRVKSPFVVRFATTPGRFPWCCFILYLFKKMKKNEAMYIGTCKITIEIPEASSIKDKRNVLRSILARLRREFRISAAEVGLLDEMDIGEIGLACVSNSVAHADEVIAKAVNFVERNLGDGIMGDYQTEVIRAF